MSGAANCAARSRGVMGGGAGLKGKVAVLLLRERLALRGQHGQRGDEARARVERVDHVVEVAHGGGGPWTREALVVLVDQRLALGGRVGGLRDALLVQHVDRAL